MAYGLSMNPSLSVIVPAHNESLRIVRTLTEVIEFGRSRLPEFEVVVVDDASTDDTAAQVGSLAAPEVRLVACRKRAGKGGAIREGVGHARHPWVLFLDADHAIRIDQTERLLPHLEEVPILVGSKRMPDSNVRYPLSRRLLGSLGQLLVRALVVGGFSDTQCGFKLLRREVAEELLSHQRLRGFGYDFEMLYLAGRLGYPAREVPVEGEDVGGGKVHWMSYPKTLAELGRLVWYRLTRQYPSRHGS
jgi:dolichyl-phosphate beta-glucosyltransferase